MIFNSLLDNNSNGLDIVCLGLSSKYMYYKVDQFSMWSSSVQQQTSTTTATIKTASYNDLRTPGVLSTSLNQLSLAGGPCIDVPLSHIPPSLKTLTLGGHFNQKITPQCLPQSLTSLTFGNSFDSDISPGSLPDSITTLNLGGSFDCTILRGVLPASLTQLTLGYYFNREIACGVLPDKLKDLRFGYMFNRHLAPRSLPQSLLSITFGFHNEKPIKPDTLPGSLTSLTLGGCFDHPLHSSWYPRSITNLILSANYKQDIEPGILSSLTSLSFFDCSFQYVCKYYNNNINNTSPISAQTNNNIRPLRMINLYQDTGNAVRTINSLVTSLPHLADSYQLDVQSQQCTLDHHHNEVYSGVLVLLARQSLAA
ncbi:hypothetical protein SAMD00019534_076010 [Acytostelium subglobosum LB1]|uniref:hypothetical protein n=1 Tax=Acytostelium subglobosum LB1 TaxID=1410327 RepID=UPI000645164A|nr:hypothetical protein SAMD00019534_076010 [Acytostelium subglobosum LB1]GAM24426.1 hypothetical protein SAMD00019534_076010 [Acytostelium subglobosum LB1]|eukprot:XP_012752752.1 hypothetical protein SAMD00019534_076010 [Acytostelium subglobosum LB1]